MAIRESQKKAVRKYNEKAYDRIELKVSKGRKADLQAHATEKGESLNGFVNRAIDETLGRDNSNIATSQIKQYKAHYIDSNNEATNKEEAKPTLTLTFEQVKAVTPFWDEVHGDRNERYQAALQIYNSKGDS